MARIKIEMIGKQFGMLTVVSEVPVEDRPIKAKPHYECRCMCGGKKVVNGSLLRSGGTKSCGCLKSKYPGGDISGIVFGKLTAIKKTGEKYRGSYIWICICACGNEVEVPINSLTSGNSKSCGCSRTPHTTGLLGKVFGNLTVTSKTDERVNGKVLWLAKCSCGSSIKVSTGALTSGNTKSCGCNKYSTPVDLKGIRFGELLAMKQVGVKNQKAVWRCECTCGVTVDVFRNSLVSRERVSCGCLSVSRGEYKISKFLNNLGVRFLTEFSFEDLYYKSESFPLRYDFAILDSRDEILLLIEFDGSQHFKSFEHFGGTSKLEETQVRDRLKEVYCSEHDITLLRITYHDYSRIEEILKGIVGEYID